MWEEIFLENFWTIFTTVISGVLVFISSQAIMEFWIKPKIEYKKLKRKILYTVNFYSGILTNPFQIDSKAEDPFKEYHNSPYRVASDELRKLGSELATYKGKIPKEVHPYLIGLSNSTWEYKNSNSFYGKENHERIEKIKELLGK